MKLKTQWVASALTLAFACAPLALAGTTGSDQGTAHQTPSKSMKSMGTAHMPSMSAGYRNWTVTQMKALQEALSAQGFHVTASGHWNDETREAVTAYQKKNGLKPTGFPNQATVKKLGLKPPK